MKYVWKHIRFKSTEIAKPNQKEAGVNLEYTWQYVAKDDVMNMKYGRKYEWEKTDWSLQRQQSQNRKYNICHNAVGGKLAVSPSLLFFFPATGWKENPKTLWSHYAENAYHEKSSRKVGRGGSPTSGCCHQSPATHECGTPFPKNVLFFTHIATM